MRKALVFIFLLLTISAVLAQYDSYGEAVLGLDDQESQFDFENNDYDYADGEEQNTLFWGSISRAFRRGFDRVKDAGRRVGDFGRRAANRVGDFGRRSWRATSNFGSNSWRATRNFGVNSWRATSNFGARAVRSTANFGVNSWRATRNFGVNSWRTTRDFSVRTYEKAKDKLEDIFAPSIPKNLGVKVASSNGPRYTRPIRNLREAVQAYAPIVYLSRGEQWFPTSAERLGDWTKVPATKLDDEKWMLPLRTDLNGFDQRAPVYVNVRDQAVPGKVLISYGFLYHYNDCGPHVRAAARASFINFDERVYPCPIGIHNGDIEHVTLYLDARTLRVESVYHAYHAFGNNVKPTEVEWEGTRPVFYSAKGSHATYLTGEKQQYVKLWKESTKAAYTFGFLEDYPERGLRWETTPRWLVYNGKINPSVTGQISSDEYKFAKFKGTLGPQIKKQSAEKIKKSLYAITWPARKLKSSWDDAISAQIKSLDSELQPTSIGCIGGKGWWSGTLEDV